MIESFTLTLEPERIPDFDPWYYPVQVNGKAVRLGKDSKASHDYLSQWQRYRDGVLGNKLLNRLNLKDKSLRDYACNCGYWGLRAAERGLKSYVGIEGRQVFIDQGQELWKQNNFTDCDYQFVQGNVADTGVERDLVDISFCIGILYHLPDWQKLLRTVAATTHEAIVVETRMHPNFMQRYPGDLKFNRIEAAGVEELRMPDYNEIVGILNEFGWKNVETLVNENKPGPLVTSGEWFNHGFAGRVAILARR